MKSQTPKKPKASEGAALAPKLLKREPAAAATPARRGRPAKTVQSRAPGRPSADPKRQADQRELMLDAALQCFVRIGIAATSLRHIATEAGVTPALVHYYFGDKPQLQQAVVKERLLPVVAELQAPVGRAGEGDTAALIAGFVQGVGAVVERHPWLPTLWVREVLLEGGALRDVLLKEVGPLIAKMMAARFAQAQQAGQLNPDLDPRLLMVSLIGLTFFPLASAPIWRALFGCDDIDFNDLRRHTLVLLDRGLELKDEN